MKNNNIRTLLHQIKDEVKIFQMLDDRELESVICCCETVKYNKGAVIFREEDSGEFMGFVVSGKLEVKKETEFKDKQIIIALLGKGSFVGEQSLFDDQQFRSATVTAVEDTEMIILRREAFRQLIRTAPHTAIKILQEIIRILSIRLRKATERLTTIF